jgi:monoamine oxidase
MRAGFARHLLVIGLLLPHSASAVTPSTDHDVVIIGAGAAGLYAAYTLNNLGYDVLVLEASDRHGGRVYSSTLGDVNVELGAEELYGTTNNFVFDDIKAEYGNSAQSKIYTGGNTQDQLISMDGGTTCFVYTGNCDKNSDISDYWDFYYHIGDHASDATDELVSDHLANTHGVTPASPGYHLYEAGTPGGEFGTSVSRLGLRSLARQDDQWSLSGSVYGFGPGLPGPIGYLDALDTLYFNQIVGKVTLNSPVVAVDTSGIKPVAIDANGVYHYANRILVTVSVGVLQAEIIDFIPDLPAAKVTAYNTIGMGHGMKLFLRFDTTPEPFWEASTIFSITTEGPTGLCWTPAKYQPGASNDVFTCFSMGLNAEFLTALADDTARLNVALADLDVVFGSGVASGKFIEGFVQDWTSEPYVLGSYSYPVPGSYPNGGPSMREILAEPVGEVSFAGEATHNTASATVPGALQSGDRAAGEIDLALGGPPDPSAPKADLEASPELGEPTLQVSFTDLSTGNPTSWSWDFGDAGTSGDQNPVHDYTVGGNYTVSLTATNASGSHTRVLPALVAVPEPGQTLLLSAGVLGLFGLDSIRRRRRQRKP